MVTINNVNIGAQDVLCMTCDVPPTKRQCSRGADLLTLSEYCINKHLTRVQAQVTCPTSVKVLYIHSMCFTGVQAQTTYHRQCESMKATLVGC